VCIVIALMVALAAARLAWKEHAKRKTTTKGSPRYEPGTPAGTLAPRTN